MGGQGVRGNGDCTTIRERPGKGATPKTRDGKRVKKPKNGLKPKLHVTAQPKWSGANQQRKQICTKIKMFRHSKDGYDGPGQHRGGGLEKRKPA